MAIAESSKFRLASIAESTPGTTPSTPAFDIIRNTGGSGLKIVQDYVTSNEININRNITDRARVARRTEANYDFELSYGALDTWFESVLQGTWSTNVLENGTTAKFLTVEEFYEMGATDQFKRAPGMSVNTMSLSIQAGQIVTGSAGLTGFGAPEVAQAIVTSATYNAAPTNTVLTASNDFASLAITGLTSPKIQSINLSMTNNDFSRPVVGSIDGVQTGSGQFDLNGDITMYFEDEDALDIFLADTYTDLSFSVGGASELKYDVVIPRIKFMDESMPKSNNSDVPLTLQFGATLDSGDGYAIEITRTPAA